MCCRKGQKEKQNKEIHFGVWMKGTESAPPERVLTQSFTYTEYTLYSATQEGRSSVSGCNLEIILVSCIEAGWTWGAKLTVSSMGTTSISLNLLYRKMASREV